MEHIKVPVCVDRVNDETVYLRDADGRLIPRMDGDVVTEMREIATALNAHDALVEACEALLIAQPHVHRMDSSERLWCRFCHASAFGLLNITHADNCPVHLAKVALALVRGDDDAND